MKLRTFGMSAVRRLWRTGPGFCLALGLLHGASSVRAETPKKEADIASRKELWVPSSQWHAILKKHPQAVMLTPEQYEALVRDAGKVALPKPELPASALATVEALHFKGSAADGRSEVLRLDGEMTLRCLTDDWTEVTARLPFRDLASVTVDGSEVLPPEVRAGPKGKAPQIGTTRRLLVHGKGSHRITLQALVPVTSTGLSATRHLSFEGTDVLGELDLQLPAGAVVTSGSLPYTREGDLLHVLLQAAAEGSKDIAWSSDSGLGQEARQLRAQGAAVITDRSIESTWALELERGATSADSTLTFDVVPASAIVVNLEGAGVSRWEQKEGKLEVTLAGRSQLSVLNARLTSVVDLQATTAAQVLDLPALRFQGHISRDLEARVEGIAEGVTLMEYQGTTPSTGSLLVWNPVRTSAKLLLRKADPRLIVDADAHAFVSRDDVTIERTLAVRTDRPVNELRVTLPQGEEFLTTSSTKGLAAEWKRVGQTIQYTWPAPLAGAQGATLAVQSRKRLPAGADAAARTVTIEAPGIADAKKLAGYVALDFDPAWRVAVTKAAGLEERDARVTPVQGKMAWFSLRSYSLSFELHRRDPVFDASITAYALPRARAVEIEGQITLDVVDAPLRQFKVAIAKESAGLVRFTSPLVGEQTLDAATGQWSLSLRKESLGRIPVRFRLSLPASTEGKEKAQEEVIKALLPSIAVPSVRRQRGVWVVEANTDTELSFDAKAMQPLDVLRAPAIEDYQPRHRVVAAFEYAGAEASLTLHAARHGHSELAALIVNRMKLTSVLSTDGGARHEAVLKLSHSGEQYVTVALPAGAQVLSASAAGNPVKPVRGPEGSIAIPLPAGSANQPEVSVSLLYETTGDSWTASGSRHLQPPTLPGHVSILATRWTVHVPDGYDFKNVQTDLTQEGTGVAAPHEEVFLAGGSNGETSKHVADSAVNVVIGQIQARATGTQSPLDLGDLDKVLKKGDQLFSNDDYAGALNEYKTVLEHTSPTPAGGEMHEVAEAKYADACVGLAQNQAKVGRYKDARALIQEALVVQPDHRGAQTLRKRLDDPDRYPAALTPEHVQKVQEVERNLQKGSSYTDLGDYDNASKSFQEVLRTDPYNVAARRGLESVEKRKTTYYAAARDHSRARMITVIDNAWEETDRVSAAEAVLKRMREIHLPLVKFDHVPVKDALERLNAMVAGNGSSGQAGGVPRIVLNGNDYGAPITLELRDVPLEEALRYVTELAGMRFTVTPQAVEVVPITETATEMVTRVYQVPPDFFASLAAQADASGGPKLAQKKAAKEMLGDIGMPFPEGSSAVYDPVTSQLIVRNTGPNLDMIDAMKLPRAKRPSAGKDSETTRLGLPLMREPAASFQEGLLPLELEIPQAGRELLFYGPLAPKELTLNYASTDRQVIHSWLLILAGGLLFAALGRRRPLLSTLLVLLLLCYGISLISEEWQPLANAVLLGWIVALALGIVWSLLKVFEPRRVEGGQA